MSSGNERLEKWRKYLSPSRLNGDDQKPSQRSEFVRDHDRIIFSSAFRRLQDKTQVFPFSSTDFTRTRLTHSLEVSSVGRTLGTLLGDHLLKALATDEIKPSDIGAIVATACFAHDIGNPPFGHAGEQAFSQWAKRNLKEHPAVYSNYATYLDPTNLADFHNFEGNAQGFRVMVRQFPRMGGVSFTAAVLAATIKYPRPAWFQPPSSPQNVAFKKFGYFQCDKELAIKVFDETGLGSEPHFGSEVRFRHPLVFLVEAADDICNRIIDLEDSHKRKLTSIKEVEDFLRPLAEDDDQFEMDLDKYPEEVRVYKLRASAMKVLAQDCFDVFLTDIRTIESGRYTKALIDNSKANDKYKEFQDKMKSIYAKPEIAELEAAGFKVIGGLLTMFADALLFDRESSQSKTLALLIPKQFLEDSAEDHKKSHKELLDRKASAYDRLFVVTDFICGMTDSYAVDLFQKLSGIKVI